MNVNDIKDIDTDKVKVPLNIPTCSLPVPSLASL